MHKTNFKHPVSGDCVVVRGKLFLSCMLMTEFFLSPHTCLINKAIQDLLHVGLKIDDQGFPSNYVVVNVKHNKDGSILLSQPVLI